MNAEVWQLETDVSLILWLVCITARIPNITAEDRDWAQPLVLSSQNRQKERSQLQNIEADLTASYQNQAISKSEHYCW